METPRSCVRIAHLLKFAIKVDYAHVQPLQLEDRAKINAAGSGFCADCVILFAVELMAGDVHGGEFVV